jgi:glyoxylase-like metal-dependent hydrolase (beta-lactamase superfamily II)
MTPELIRFDRRRFLAIAPALVAAGLLPKAVLAFTGPATATVGTVELTVLSDGTLTLPASVFATDADPAAVAALMGAAADGTVAAQATPVLIRDGEELILVDTGAGAGFQPTAGKLAESFAAAGVDPAAVTRVVFTHAHPDHLFGAATPEGLICPNATYLMGRAEHGFWTNPGIFEMLPAEYHPFAQGAQATIGAIGERLALFDAGQPMTANLMAIDTPGHTPGHLSLEIAGGDGAIVTGDAIPSSLVHFAHPDWAFGFDADAALAATTRKALLARAAAEKKLMVGYHWPQPLGRAEADGEAFRFVPA